MHQRMVHGMDCTLSCMHGVVNLSTPIFNGRRGDGGVVTFVRSNLGPMDEITVGLQYVV